MPAPTLRPGNRAASRLTAVEAELVVVPMGRVPTTPAELLATMTGHTSTFAGSPTPGNAKKPVKAALMHLGVEGATLSARTVDDGSGPRVAVRIVLPSTSAGSAEVERKLLGALVPEQLTPAAYKAGLVAVAAV